MRKSGTVVPALVDGFRNSPHRASYFPFQHFPFQHFPFQHFPFQPALRKENAGKENESRKLVGYF
jgi:hypothetical protein